ncbi:MAG TPA: NUDIX domain-containing protein [Anaerolineaceae bacterium]|nr:NUDIX domain-containing protein [Anaerolineaceae bacterium]
MSFDESKYRKGYSIGVGGVVIHNGEVLLVRRIRGEDLGEWAIPGGFVEKNEKADKAIIREVLEETGVKARVKGLIAIRNRIYKDENSIYLMFLLETDIEELKAQKSEVDKVGFFNLSQVNGISNLQTLSKIVVEKVLKNEHKLLPYINQDDFPDSEYGIFG